MKNNQELTGKEKLELAEKTILQLLARLGFRANIIGDFIMNIYDTDKKKLDLLNKIEHGVDKYSYTSLQPEWVEVRGEGRPDRWTQRNMLINIGNHIFIIGCVFLSENDETKIDSTKLNASIIEDKKNRKTLDAITSCFIQLIALAGDISETDLLIFLGIVKKMRNHLEVTQMELHLANQQTYPPEIKQVDLFLRILENRIKTPSLMALR